jgi:hypothetical protein
MSRKVHHRVLRLGLALGKEQAGSQAEQKEKKDVD